MHTCISFDACVHGGRDAWKPYKTYVGILTGSFDQTEMERASPKSSSLVCLSPSIPLPPSNRVWGVTGHDER